MFAHCATQPYYFTSPADKKQDENAFITCFYPIQT